MNNSDRPMRNEGTDAIDDQVCDEREDEISNVIEIGRLVTDRSREAMSTGEVGAKEVISIWKAVDPGIKRVFETFEELGIDTEPLGRRILIEEDPDILQIIIHLREFTATILRAIELRVDAGVKVIHVHPQKSMSLVALEFAEKVRKQNDISVREKLVKLHEWLGSEESNAKVLMDYINKCK